MATSYAAPAPFFAAAPVTAAPTSAQSAQSAQGAFEFFNEDAPPASKIEGRILNGAAVTAAPPTLKAAAPTAAAPTAQVVPETDYTSVTITRISRMLVNVM